MSQETGWHRIGIVVSMIFAVPWTLFIVLLAFDDWTGLQRDLPLLVGILAVGIVGLYSLARGIGWVVAGFRGPRAQ